MKFDWKKLRKSKAFWAGLVAVLAAAGVALPPGTVEALMIFFGG